MRTTFIFHVVCRCISFHWSLVFLTPSFLLLLSLLLLLLLNLSLLLIIFFSSSSPSSSSSSLSPPLIPSRWPLWGIERAIHGGRGSLWRLLVLSLQPANSPPHRNCWRCNKDYINFYNIEELWKWSFPFYNCHCYIWQYLVSFYYSYDVEYYQYQP